MTSAAACSIEWAAPTEPNSSSPSSSELSSEVDACCAADCETTIAPPLVTEGPVTATCTCAVGEALLLSSVTDSVAAWAAADLAMVFWMPHVGRAPLALLYAGCVAALFGYIGELLLNPTALALIGAIVLSVLITMLDSILHNRLRKHWWYHQFVFNNIFIYVYLKNKIEPY